MRDELAEIERHVLAGIGLAERLPLIEVSSGRCSLPSRQAAPSSSGVTATGENAVGGFDT